jgi:4,5-DOPA dioxygenase extradiol
MSKMPVLFIGHGSPMNAIEDNVYTQNWREIAAKIPRPAAILSVSAHWFTAGTRLNDDLRPQTIYDMYGFPRELYEVVYQPAGAPELAHLTKELIDRKTQIDNSWGIDHGTWSVLNVMYPLADIPVFQLSVNQNESAAYHYAIGEYLKALREKGVLILGSGNVVHNLAMLNWNMEKGYDWALDFDGYIKRKIMSKDYAGVIDYQKAGKSSEIAFFTPEHFFPLLYTLGAVGKDDYLTVFNDACTMGSLSMTSYLFT